MMHPRHAALLITAAALAACTDYATFVTATDIGITADVKTQEIGIGYSRTELFTGPGYPEQGEALQAVGFLASNLSPFAPHIKQLYATGDAAALVTQDTGSSAGQVQTTNYYGQRRPLVFATGANVGLKVGFAGTAGPMPTSIKFGYNREEVSIIPLRGEAPTQTSQDKYAPVLAAIDMDLATPGLPETKLALTQFFATGEAARNLARHPEIRKYFGWQTAAAVWHATSLEALNQVLSNDTQKIRDYFTRNGFSTTSRDTLLRASGNYDEIPIDLKTATTADGFFSALGKYPLLASTLADSIPK